MKTLVPLMLLTLTLTSLGCSKREDPEYNYGRWSRSTITKIARSDGTSFIPNYILDCRRVQDAANLHYYYSVIVDPNEKPELKKTNDGEVETYHSATFDIQSSSDLYNKNGSHSHSRSHFYSAIDLSITKNAAGDRLYSMSLNARRSQNYGSMKPYFAALKENDIVMAVSHPKTGSPINVTDRELPGVSPKEDLECK